MSTDSLRADFDYQEQSLQGVSRTFALTIPQLPATVFPVVGNAYLLCRIADTIEDDAGLSFEQKDRFSEQFIDVVAGRYSPEAFAKELHPMISDGMLAAERDLVLNTTRVIRLTHSFNSVQRNAMERCIRIMSRGMADFQRIESRHGLNDLPHMDSYCYHVAGVVGEMLTEIFIDYSPEITKHQDELMELSVSFGQALQMTNILKDIHGDYERGACWLPRQVFLEQGFNLDRLTEGPGDPAWEQGLGQLIGVATEHLHNALRYTLLIPDHETGIRRFCLWALGMAILTIRKINKNRSFTSGQDVKISRRAVRTTVITANLAVHHDTLLRALFRVLTRSLPRPAAEYTVNLLPHRGIETP